LPTTAEQRFGRGSGGITGRGFRPGASGNPTGRSRDSLDIAKVARQYGPKCIEVVAKLLTDRDKKVRLSAAQTLLDRGFGRPAQHVTTDGEQNVTLMHLVAARAISVELHHGLAPPPAIEGTLQPQGGDLTEPALE
jgi:hypothetical protein